MQKRSCWTLPLQIGLQQKTLQNNTLLMQKSNPSILNEIEKALSLPEEFNSPLFEPLKAQNKSILDFLTRITLIQLQRICSYVQDKLPQRNSTIVEFNDGLTVATNSNTCVCVFGSPSQSCNGVKYATKYEFFKIAQDKEYPQELRASALSDSRLIFCK